MEIERQFKVEEIPFDLDEYEGEEYVQFYTHVNGDEEKRYRKVDGEKYIYTEKKGKGLEREEKEIKITEEEYEDARDRAEGVIWKTRYKVPYQEHEIEMDVYHGDLDGFKSAEVEFSSKEESRRFNPPDWFEEEVTQDPRYKNKTLATEGLPED